MKYLRPFRLVESHQAFTELTKAQWYVALQGPDPLHKITFIEENWEDIKPPEAQQLWQLYQAAFPTTTLTYSPQAAERNKKSFPNLRIYQTGQLDSYIFKLVDEWYYIELMLPSDLLTSRYFRCDQMSGVLECLQSFNI